MNCDTGRGPWCLFHIRSVAPVFGLSWSVRLGLQGRLAFVKFLEQHQQGTAACVRNGPLQHMSVWCSPNFGVEMFARAAGTLVYMWHAHASAYPKLRVLANAPCLSASMCLSVPPEWTPKSLL